MIIIDTLQTIQIKKHEKDFYISSNHSITFLTLSCSDDKSDNSEPDYILSSLTEWIFKSKGEEKEIMINCLC